VYGGFWKLILWVLAAFGNSFMTAKAAFRKISRKLLIFSIEAWKKLFQNKFLNTYLGNYEV
jgi:hypothetical protein